VGWFYKANLQTGEFSRKPPPGPGRTSFTEHHYQHPFVEIL